MTQTGKLNQKILKECSVLDFLFIHFYYPSLVNRARNSFKIKIVTIMCSGANPIKPHNVEWTHTKVKSGVAVFRIVTNQIHSFFSKHCDNCDFANAAHI